MSVQERFDIVVKVLEGPMKHMGDQVLRGPVVRLGAEPGAGGLRLAGYRGLAKRHAVITAYDKGNASIAPVGTNQVRMAPHQHVNWKEIDPMSGPEFLSEGCAVHLGPVGRGVTIEFVEVRKLGMWQQGGLASEADSAGVIHQGRPQGPAGLAPPGGAPPAAFDARKSQTIRASTVPIWFLGGLFVMVMMTVTIVLSVVFVWRARTITKLGPTEPGLDAYEFVSADAEPDSRLLDGLQGGFDTFVMKHNAELAGRSRLREPDNWDQEFYNRVAASVEAHVKAWNVFKRLDVVKDDYAEVVTIMRDEGLPEVFAGIPYLESRYKAKATSVVCAHGYWQFMPEVAHRVDTQTRLDFTVKDCRFRDADVVWSPEKLAPPFTKSSPYVMFNEGKYKCRIKRCDVDDREHLEKSSRAAAFTLREALEDPDIAASGAAVQIAIASHNGGYDDRRFGKGGKWNMRHAYRRWSKGKPKDEWHRFYGENIKCGHPGAEGEERVGSCGAEILAEPQHYSYTAVAQHMIAVCYYAQNYAQESAFKPWAVFLDGKGYCNTLDIPRAEQVRKHKG